MSWKSRRSLAPCLAVAMTAAQVAGPSVGAQPVTQPAIQPVIASAAPRTVPDPRSCDGETELPATGAWSSIELPSGVSVVSLAAAGGKAFVFGHDFEARQGPVEVAFAIDLESRKLQPLDGRALASPWPKQRRHFKEARCVRGEIVLWGSGDQGGSVAWGAIYHPGSDSWRQMTTRGAPSSAISATDGVRLYVFEPSEHGVSGASYDLEKNQWLPMATGPAGFTGDMRPQFVDGKFWLFGCRQQGLGSCALLTYDPRADRWAKPVEAPAHLATDPKVRGLAPFVLGDALRFAVLHDGGASRLLRLGSAGKWHEDKSAVLQGRVHATFAGGQKQALVWGSAEIRGSPQRFQLSRARLNADLTSAPLPPPPLEASVTEHAPLQLARGLMVLAATHAPRGGKTALWLWR